MSIKDDIWIPKSSAPIIPNCPKCELPMEMSERIFQIDPLFNRRVNVSNIHKCSKCGATKEVFRF